MKKIISGIISMVMLSSTAAMAETVFAPTPQNKTTTYIQNFDSESDDDKLTYGWRAYGQGDEPRVYREIYGGPGVEVVANPFEETGTTDMVLQHMHDTTNQVETANYTMNINKELTKNDIVIISFDAALMNPYRDRSYLKLAARVNGTDNISVFKVFSNGYIGNEDFMDANVEYNLIKSPASDEFTHYEIIFDIANNVITYVSGDSADSYPMKSDIKISSMNSFAITTEHTEGETTGEAAYYINNMSYSIINKSAEKVETFDTCRESANRSGWRKAKVVLPNVTYKLDMGKAESTQELDPTRGRVLKTSGYTETINYLAMPLDYTMDNDDVFTFSFDYANEKNEGNSLVFALDDLSADTQRDMSIKLTSVVGPIPTWVDDPIGEYNITRDLFTISGGYVRIGNNWYSQGASESMLNENEFNTITVVIDNSDEEYDNKRTFAVYVNGKLVATKWYMDDNDEATNSRHISGVSLYFNNSHTVRYFDNMWATLTENEITVDNDTASYTYPVVYDDATEADLVVGYYGANGEFISGKVVSATPSNGSRTVTADVTKPEGASAVKVFRWNKSINPLTPVWDSTAQ